LVNLKGLWIEKKNYLKEKEVNNLKLDFGGIESFLTYLEGRSDERKLLDNPAYQTVFKHGRKFGREMSPEDIKKALQGKQSPFYGLDNLERNKQRIEEILKKISEDSNAWFAEIKDVLAVFFPEVTLDQLTVYPIIGYDVGIGLDNNICLNINDPLYLNEHREFFPMVGHEGFHALYNQVRPFPSVHDLETIQKRLDFFYSLIQNEGYAVFIAWKIRRGKGLEFYDHPLLEDFNYVESSPSPRLWDNFQKIKYLIEAKPEMSLEEYLETAFGAARLTYRLGGTLVRAINEEYGEKGLQKGACLLGEDFFDHFNHLFKKIFN